MDEISGHQGNLSAALFRDRSEADSDISPPLSFLVAGGELGARIRQFEWATNPLGCPENWPQSLKTAVRIMLLSRQAIWIGWGKELIYLYNDAYIPIVGGRHPWALGQPASIVWPETWSEIGPQLSTAMSGHEGTYVEAKLLIMERNGYPEETYYTYSYTPIPGDDGRPGGIICANTDDTQRVIGERQLESLRELATRTADARTVADVCERSASALQLNHRDLLFALIYLKDADGNGFSLRSTSGFEAKHVAAPAKLPLRDHDIWPAGEVMESRTYRIVDDIPARLGVDLPMGSWQQAGTAAAILPIGTFGDTGSEGVLIVGLNPFRLLDDNYRSFLELISQQISAAIANAETYERELHRAEALAAIDKAKTAFFSNVSHEFRTPLTLMIGPLSDALAHLDELPASRKEGIVIAHRNTLRLLRLVNMLLDFSRVEAGRVQPRREEIDLSLLTRDLASNFRAICERAGIALLVETAGLKRRAYVDKDMWEKIVLNLISNAFKFTFHGSITVRLMERDDTIVLIVRDTGTGITPADLPRIFERFHRVEGQRGRTHEGSGIGLALVKELVRLHGGEVNVESVLNQGTSFEIRLPYEHPAIKEMPPSDRDDGPLAAAFVEEASRWLPDAVVAAVGDADAINATGNLRERAKILFADDNADMRDYVRRLLSERYDVKVAQHGEDALHLIRQQPPDLVLADVMMPVMDGFALLREIRNDSKLQQIPVILLSARAGEEARVEGIDAGADDYLTKPFSVRELLARVRTNIEMSRVRRSMAAALEIEKSRLQAVLETVPAGVWFTFDSDARTTTGNKFANELLRMPQGGNASLSSIDETRPLHFRAFRDGREIEADMLPIQRAARGELVVNDEFEVRFADGASLALLAQAAPIRDVSGNVLGAVAACLDISERKRAENHRALLLNELNHRVKNTLATVQSIAAQSFKGGLADPSARSLFESRLMGLSRIHDVLTSENWEGADLDEVASQAVQPHQGKNTVRVEISGPAVRLSAKTALAISMALHELATNAAKYGALSEPAGRVIISWRRDSGSGEECVVIEWRETGGPSVKEPKQKGFGSRLIERGLAQELGGRAKIDYQPSGVVCEIIAPLQEETPIG